MKPSTEENAEKRKMFNEIIAKCEDGAVVDWLWVEIQTGIYMSPGNRELFKREAKAMHRPFEILRGAGIRLSSDGSAMTIVNGRLVGIRNKIRKANRDHKDLASLHLNSMPETDRERFIMTGSFLSALSGNAKRALEACEKKNETLPLPNVHRLVKV